MASFFDALQIIGGLLGPGPSDIPPVRNTGLLEVDTARQKEMDLAKSLSSRQTYEDMIEKGLLSQTYNPYSSLIEYGVDPVELQGIIAGESSGNPQAQNKRTKASGLFQFTPTAAKELGTSVDDILQMPPEDQGELYLKYLKRWGWKPGVPLGLMQAAPSLARTWDSRSKEDVVYKKGSRAWKANPGWRPEGGGDITVSSIENYYASKQ